METSAQREAGFKRVKDAIRKRDISEVSWTLLDLAVDEMQVNAGQTSMGKTALMELIRTISIQKNQAGMD